MIPEDRVETALEFILLGLASGKINGAMTAEEVAQTTCTIAELMHQAGYTCVITHDGRPVQVKKNENCYDNVE